MLSFMGRLNAEAEEEASLAARRAAIVLRVGSKVEANYQQTGHWYSGVIAKVSKGCSR